MADATRENERTSFDCYVHSMLSPHELELYELCKTSGVTINPKIFKIIIQLIQMDVDPMAIFTLLQSIAMQIEKNAKRNEQSKKTSKSSSKKPPVAAKPKKF